MICTYVDQTGSAVMLVAKSLVEVNLRTQLRTGKKACKQGIYLGYELQYRPLPHVQNRGIRFLCPPKTKQ